MTTELQLHHIVVGQMDNNCYLLTAGGEGLLIDAATDANALISLAQDAGVEITTVLTTHRHADHVGALEEVLYATGARHIASYLDSPALPAKVDLALENGATFEFAGHELPAIILRGHTPGGLATAANIDGVPNLFVGDSLFPGGVGKTASEGDFFRLYKDVVMRLFSEYPDETVVHPGHGDPTTLGEERPHLEEWRERRW